MKKIIIILLVLAANSVSATDYYVAANGDDSNNGTSTSTPFKTLAKINSLTLVPGDNIYFRRGDTFRGFIVMKQGGNSSNRITFSCYGTGPLPVITGFSDVVGWVNKGGNIWESASAVSELPRVEMLTINGKPIPMGKYPNSDSVYPYKPNYLYYQSHSGTNPTTSITSDQFDSTDYTGADIVVRGDRWGLYRSTVTSVSDNTINFSGVASYEGFSNNNGFFIQNDIKTLDVQNEWFYDKNTGKLSMYSTTEPSGVQVSSIDTLFSTTLKHYITLKNIEFTGSNLLSVFSYYADDVIMDSLIVRLSGNIGIKVLGSKRNRVTNTKFYDNGITGIFIAFNAEQNYFGYNEFRRTYLSTNFHTAGAAAAHFSESYNSVFELNRIDSSGYKGLTVQGDSIWARKNFVNNSCIITDDGAGIYSGRGKSNTMRVYIEDNIVLNSIGNANGVFGDSLAHGIYIDHKGGKFNITGNTVAGNSNAGLFIASNKGDTIRDNTAYDNGGNSFARGAIMFHTSDGAEAGYAVDNYIVNNIWFAKKPNQYSVFLYENNPDNLIENYGVIDSNYFAKPIDKNTITRYQKTGVGTSVKTLAQWTEATTKDANSTLSPLTVDNTDKILFIYNPTNSDSTVTLTKKYTDAKGNQFDDGKIVLQPFKSAVLVETGSLEPQPVPGMVIRDYLLFRGSFLGN